MANRGGRTATQGKFLLSGILEQGTAKDCPVTVDSVDAHTIGVSSAFDWGMDCVAAINQVGIADRYYDRAVSTMLQLMGAELGAPVRGAGPACIACVSPAGYRVCVVNISQTMLRET